MSEIVNSASGRATPVVIASSGTTSTNVTVGGGKAVGVATPDNLRGVGSITFETSYDGVTWYPIYDSLGDQVSLALSTSRLYYLDPIILLVARQLRFVANVSPSSDLTLQLITTAVV